MIEVIHGDCLEVMKGMEDNSIDLVLTDPPYGIGMDGGNVGYKGNNNLEKMCWDKETPTKEYFSEMIRVGKNCVIFGGNYFTLPPSRCYLVWDKGEGFYNRTYAECELARTNIDDNTKKIKYDPLAGRDYVGKLHPTQKPLTVFRRILENYSEPGMKILDCFAGSGTTGVACKELGRDCILIEKEKKYIDIINKRLDNTTVSLFH